ncbi:hypothetical protein C0993_001139 [Termitomyces sp. T159_Od127]|nr:hypothetical protein C0993_001139 [Termitomyces sp. T159_Od127]
MSANYNTVDSHPSPYGAGDPYYNESSGYITPHPVKKRMSNWVKIGVPVLILVIIAAVLGGVLGSRASKSNDESEGSSSGSQGEAAASSAASMKLEIGRFATATNSEFMMPIYPSTTNTAAFTSPTFTSTKNEALAWPADPFKPSKPEPTITRTDRPRLIAPAYKWQALPKLIKGDPYLKGWNDTIFGNASQYFTLPPVQYNLDGGNGILDNAREIKMRIKAFAYVYHMTNDTKWVDRTWNAAGNGTSPFGPDSDKWNSGHFLDTAEMTAAFAIAYDWLYSQWTEDQKSQIRFTLIKYGLHFGVTPNPSALWWQTNTEGNWNCVCNSGLTLGALAILNDDTSGIAEQVLGQTIPNALKNCALAVSDDGTWSETANYWYFGTTGHAEILINQANQNVAAAPVVTHDTSGTTQGSSTVLDIPKDSTAYWVTDISSAYFNGDTVKRGVRLLNGRKQVLIQDEIQASASVQWRMHTNATVNIDSSGTSATLTLDGQTLIIQMIEPPSGAAFSTSAAARFASDPIPPAPDQENPGVTVLMISLPAGSYTLQTLFNPQWSGMSASDFVKPPTVALAQWSLTSHDN